MVNCCFKGCRNDSRLSDRDYMLGIYFLPFPKPKTQLEKCKRWIAACCRPEFLTLDKITKHRYVCSFHFVGGKGPTKLNPDPLPYHEYCKDDTHNKCSISNCSPVELTDVEVDKAVFDTIQAILDSLISDSLLSDSLVSDLSVSDSLISDLSVSDSLVSDSAVSDLAVSESVLTNSLASRTNENEASIGNVAVINKIQSTIINNITDLYQRFIEYQYYQKSDELTWTLSKNGDSNLSFLKITTPYICVIEVKILPNLEFDIYIYGKKLLKPHRLLTPDKAPQNISNLSDLIRLIIYLDSLAVCNGCGDATKNCPFSEKYGFIHIYTKELHSQKCQGLILDTTYRSCNSCKIFRKSLISKSKKLKVVELTGSKNYQGTYAYASKSKVDLLELLKRKTSNCKALKKKNKSLVFRLEKTKNQLRDALAGGNNALFGEANYEDPFCSKDNFLRILLSEQTKLLKMNRKRPKQWHPAIIKWCMYLRAKSPSTYNTLRDVLPLPSSRTLLKYYSEFTCESGFTAKALSEMHEKIDLNNSSEHQKYFSLVVDEMKIKEDIIYKATTGEIVGFCHSSDSGNILKQVESEKNGGDTSENLPIASHVMCLMVRGLATNFKHTLAYFPCHEMKADELFLIIQEAIEILECNGFKVLTVVCDKSAINQKMIKLSTELDPVNKVHYRSANVYVKPGETRYIYYISDPPHLIKTVRNCFSNSGGHKNSRLLRKNQKHILWSHVVDMYKKDCSSQWRLCSKLTDSHIILGPFNRMSVKFATQIMSNTVAEAINTLVGGEALETVKFVKIFNRFFDMLNTRNISQGIFSRNSDMMPYKDVNDWRFAWLKETFLGYLKEWEEEVNKSNFPDEEKAKMQLSRETLDGIYTTVYSIIEATTFLLHQGAPFVLTDKFNQDPLERHFGKHRRSLGCNENPTLLAYSYSERKFKIMRAIINSPKNGNTSRRKMKKARKS